MRITESHLAPQAGPDRVGPDRVGLDQVRGEQIGQDLADIVSRLRRAMRRAARAADPALGLSVAQLELLSCITEHPGIRPGQLARMLRLAPSSVATLLGGLQSAGYVTRTPGGDSDGDRRTGLEHLLVVTGIETVYAGQRVPTVGIRRRPTSRLQRCGRRVGRRRQRQQRPGPGSRRADAASNRRSPDHRARGAGSTLHRGRQLRYADLAAPNASSR